MTILHPDTSGPRIFARDAERKGVEKPCGTFSGGGVIGITLRLWVLRCRKRRCRWVGQESLPLF